MQGAVIRMDDVSEKVRMEELMVQSAKMLSVGGLAAGIAHGQDDRSSQIGLEQTLHGLIIDETAISLCELRMDGPAPPPGIECRQDLQNPFLSLLKNDFRRTLRLGFSL